MSSTSSSPTLTSATDSAAASATTSGSSGSGGFSPPSSTLYLLTFLATLFVLLFVSCAIVLRSFLIRRRFRRHIEQQIAAGILPPDALDPHPKRDFGEKPKLWDVYVEPQDVKGLVEYDGWEDVLPMSARITHDPSIHSNDSKTTPSSSHPESTQPPSTPVIHPPRYWNLAQLFRRPSRYQLPSDASISSVVEDTSPPEITPDQDIQVAVMVAMPSQSHRHESLPEILIGMSTVPVKGD